MKHRFPIIFLIGTIVIFLGLVFFIMRLLPGTPPEKDTTTVPTPFPLVLSRHYAAPKKAYSLDYPPTWQQINDLSDPVTTFAYTQDEKQYRFTVSPPGQINPEGENFSTVEETEVSYRGKVFVRRLWHGPKYPFFILAFAKDDTSNPYFYTMELPPKNTDLYIKQFDLIMASVKE